MRMMENDLVRFDLVEIISKLWRRRYVILGGIILGILTATVVIVCSPNIYLGEVKIIPESSSSSGNGFLGKLSSMGGMDITKSNDEDVLPTSLYTEVVFSSPFMLDLMRDTVKVGEGQCLLIDYVLKDQKTSWWNKLFSFNKFGNGHKQETIFFGDVLLRKINPEEQAFVNYLKKHVTVRQDKATELITVSVYMQDPQVAALVASLIVNKMQQFIIAFRTLKARNNLEYLNKLLGKSESDYLKASNIYGEWLDANQNVVSESYGTIREKLKREANMTFDIYNQIRQKVELAKIQIQKDTPVLGVIDPAVVPVGPELPNKKLTLVAFVLLFGLLVPLFFTRFFNKNNIR